MISTFDNIPNKDRDPKNPAHHIPIVKKVAGSIVKYNRDLEFDEVVNELWPYLVLACESYDSTRGHHYTHIVRCLEQKRRIVARRVRYGTASEVVAKSMQATRAITHRDSYDESSCLMVDPDDLSRVDDADELSVAIQASATGDIGTLGDRYCRGISSKVCAEMEGIGERCVSRNTARAKKRVIDAVEVNAACS